MIQYTDLLYGYASHLDLYNYYVQLLNVYFPYGAFFWITGFLLFGVFHIKTQNYQYSGAVTAVYFMVMGNTGLVFNAYSAQAMQYFGLMLGVLIGISLYREVKGDN